MRGSISTSMRMPVHETSRAMAALVGIERMIATPMHLVKRSAMQVDDIGFPPKVQPQSRRSSNDQAQRRHQPHRACRLSVLFIERGLTALVGHLLADVGYLGAHLEHD